MLGFLTKIFGNKSDKDVKEVTPLVEQINQEFEALQPLSHDELRQKSVDFRKRIQDYIAPINGEIDTLTQKAESDETSFDEKDAIYNDIDKLEKDRDGKIEEVLKEILPQAFAVMKETARRFTENETITVAATDLDKDLAVEKDFVKINGDKATYKNSWNVAGIDVKWGMVSALRHDAINRRYCFAPGKNCGNGYW